MIPKNKLFVLLLLTPDNYLYPMLNQKEKKGGSLPNCLTIKSSHRYDIENIMQLPKEIEQIIVRSHNNDKPLWYQRNSFQYSTGNKYYKACFIEENSELKLVVKDETMITLWDPLTQQKVKNYPFSQFQFIKESDKKNIKIITLSGEYASIWDIDSQKEIGAFQCKYEDRPTLFALSNTTNSLLITRRSSSACIWDIAQGKKLASLTHDRYNLNHSYFSNDCSQIGTIDSNNTAYLWQHYNDYNTIDQIAFCHLLKVLPLLKRLSRSIKAPELLILEMAALTNLNEHTLYQHWRALPEKLRLHLWKNINRSIQQYGYDNDDNNNQLTTFCTIS